MWRERWGRLGRVQGSSDVLKRRTREVNSSYTETGGGEGRSGCLFSASYLR